MSCQVCHSLAKPLAPECSGNGCRRLIELWEEDERVDDFGRTGHGELVVQERREEQHLSARELSVVALPLKVLKQSREDRW